MDVTEMVSLSQLEEVNVGYLQEGNEFQWFPMVSNGFEWFRMVSNGFKWFRMVLNGFEWFTCLANRHTWHVQSFHGT